MTTATTSSDIATRLSALRTAMNRHGLDAWIQTSTDPHQSEYVADYWAARTWLTGFTGSAGVAIVTADHAGLWTDSRYFIQAEQELGDGPFELHKQGIPHAPEHRVWLRNQLPKGARVGIDGKLVTIAGLAALEGIFAEKGITLVTEHDIIAEAWTDRPPMPEAPVVPHPTELAGMIRMEKLTRVRAAMKEAGVDHHLVSTLDDVAWLMNLRGDDVNYNPVFYGYVLISNSKSTLFVAPGKVSETLELALEEAGTVIAPYADLAAHLGALEGKLLVDTGKTSVAVRNALGDAATIVNGKTPSTAMKAVKNATEIAHFRRVMVRDAVALLRLYRWIDAEIDGGELTEVAVAEKLAALRGENPEYRGESFGAIAGYAGNGAIVHYRPAPESCATLKREGIFLLDSGGQYVDGTTDITRTTCLGTPTPDQIRNYTLVLKGHIGIATAKFPAGTKGYHLDSFARMPLWQHGLNYGHGTGHGIGFHLCVHEGPQ
ncbi:MAG: aminopeptidase P family N-terminal domain-containing protein, partial [Bacteroidota bacterium]